MASPKKKKVAPQASAKSTSAKKSFTSFRIIGEKAQRLLAKAKEAHRSGDKTDSHSLLPLLPKYDEFVVHMSVRSVVKGAFAILAIYVGTKLFMILIDKIILLLLAIFLATIIDPGVESLKRMGIPRGLGVILQYLIAVLLIVFLLFSLIPIIASQIQQIAVLLNARVNMFLADPQVSIPLLTPLVNEQLTFFVQSNLQNLEIREFADALRQFGQGLNTAAQGSIIFAAQVAGSVFEFIGKVVVVFVLAFFMQVEKTRILSWLRGFLGNDYRAYANDKAEVIHFKLAQWARGQLILCCAIGVLVFTALTILGMPYALTLAILAGFTEFIPVIGPFIAAVPSVLIATTERGLVWGLVLIGVYYVIQWCENNLLVPLIMKRAVGLSPIAILFAMLVGISFPHVIHPILGVMLAIPTTTIISLFLDDLRELRGQKRRADV
jgi:predicted PurR-regulated permease PerM